MSRPVYAVPGSPGPQVADDDRGARIRPTSKCVPGALVSTNSTFATTLDPLLWITAEPLAKLTNGTTGDVPTGLKSQFLSAPRKGTRVGPPPLGEAAAMSTASVIAGEVTNVIAAANVPNFVSVRI